MTTPLEATDLDAEIREHVKALADRYGQVFTTTTPAGKITSVTTWYVNGLRGKRGGADGAADVARDVVEYLVDATALEADAFWSGVLGRAVAFHIGYHREVVPTPVAAVILGVTRQAVHDARKRGALLAGPGGAGIDRASLLAYLRAQFLGAGA